MKFKPNLLVLAAGCFVAGTCVLLSCKAYGADSFPIPRWVRWHGLSQAAFGAMSAYCFTLAYVNRKLRAGDAQGEGRK
jgi:hypothetical protein